jgi:hypothetical protein
VDLGSDSTRPALVIRLMLITIPVLRVSCRTRTAWRTARIRSSKYGAYESVRVNPQGLGRGSQLDDRSSNLD